MAQTPPPPHFAMPMYHDWVPKKIRPWIYVLTAFCFQFSGGVYLGSLNDMVGEHQWMREDVTMLLYCNLAGMAVWFPVLFRMKFRFTNKALIMTSAVVIILCNLLTMHRLPLPLMWVICFVSGVAKIQGTFECMSNIQLWMTPKRDFAVFFPVLHIILLTSIEGAGWLAATFAFYAHWTLMHVFVIGLMILVLTLQACLCRPFCPMPPAQRVPLKGIDWLSAAMWATFWLQVAWILNYGDWHDWMHSPAIVAVIGTTCITLGLIMIRMRMLPNAYIEWRIVRYRYFRPIILFVALFEVIMSVENVLEKIFYESVMHYTDLTYETLNQWSLIGIWAGCLFSMGWLKLNRWSQYRLIGIGMSFIALYCVGFYCMVTPAIGYYDLVIPIVSRGFGYAILSITFMWSLNQVMSFNHFFQALSIFNFLHMFGGGAIGGALLARGTSYYVGDGFARYNGFINSVTFSRSPFDLGAFMETMSEAMLAQTVKIMYGWMIWGCLLFIAIFLLWDRPGVRRRVKRMPSWSKVGAWTLNEIIKGEKRLRAAVKVKAVR